MNNGNGRAASDSRRTPTYFKERSFPNRLRTSKPTKKKKKHMQCRDYHTKQQYVPENIIHGWFDPTSPQAKITAKTC